MTQFPARLPVSSCEIPVSFCERCGEADGLKAVQTDDGPVWHCFGCRRAHAVRTEKHAEQQAFLSRPASFSVPAPLSRPMPAILTFPETYHA